MKNILPLLVICSGCAYNRPVLIETTTVHNTNGVITVTDRKLTMRSYVLWPASSELGKQKASLGKTLTVGTEGLGQESNSTNALAMVQGVAEIFKAIASMKP